MHAKSYLLSIFILVAAPAEAADPFGDYGDAPDRPDVWAGFPTRFNTSHSFLWLPGAHHLNTGQEMLGVAVSVEAGATDTFDPDGQPNITLVSADLDGFDDGARFADAQPFFQPFVAVPKSVWSAGVVVSVALGAPAGPRYLNVVTDADADGRWKNNMATTEWVVKNFAVNLAPGTSETFLVNLGAHAFSLGPVWTRFTLTRSPIPYNEQGANAGWDGSGVFDFGETEDYYADGGYGVDPSVTAPPGYNPQIQLPPPCRPTLELECDPPPDFNYYDHTDAAPVTVGFKARVAPHPGDVPPTCSVNWYHEQYEPEDENSKNAPRRPGKPIADADIGDPYNGAGVNYPVRPTDTAAVPFGVVGPAERTFEIYYDVDFATDGPDRTESRRIENGMAFTCCGNRRYSLAVSCGLAIGHEDIPGLGRGFEIAASSSGQDQDPPTQFGITWQTGPAGRVAVKLMRDDPDFMRPRHLRKLWSVGGSFAYVSDPPTPPASLSQFRFDFTDQELIDAGIDPQTEKQRLVVGRLAMNHVGDDNWTLDVGSALIVDGVLNRITIQNPKAFGVYAIGLPEAFSPNSAGQIPARFRLSRVNVSTARISWDPSCSPEAVDYSIYRGTIGLWYSHTPFVCSDRADGVVGSEALSLLDAVSRYYLIVPKSKDVEGSYGLRSGGVERPRSPNACTPVQLVGGCTDPACSAVTTPLPVPSITPISGDGSPASAFNPACPSIGYDPDSEWFFRVVGTGGAITARTCSNALLASSFETRTSVYEGSCDDLTCVAGNDNVPGPGCDGGSSVTWCTTAGAEYRVQVHGAGPTGGAFTLSLANAGPCAPGAAGSALP